MINIIRVLVSYYENPSEEQLDLYSDRIITAVDDYCNNRQRSFIINRPSEENIKAGRINYEWEIEVDDCSVNAHELFDVVNPVTRCGKLLLVDVRDLKYDPRRNKSNVGYYWTNEGSTWYHDSQEGYKDPNWEFHENGYSDYRIIHIPTYASKLTFERDRNYYKEKGATFMWSCTACYDNWMKATNIEEAIEEFEEIYREQLWKSVEGYQKGLDRATTSFRQFDEYRRNKKC